MPKGHLSHDHDPVCQPFLPHYLSYFPLNSLAERRSNVDRKLCANGNVFDLQVFLCDNVSCLGQEQQAIGGQP